MAVNVDDDAAVGGDDMIDGVFKEWPAESGREATGILDMLLVLGVSLGVARQKSWSSIRCNAVTVPPDRSEKVSTVGPAVHGVRGGVRRA